MSKYLYACILLLLGFVLPAQSPQGYHFSGFTGNGRSPVVYNQSVYFGSPNGLSLLDQTTGSITYINPMNSPMQGYYDVCSFSVSPTGILWGWGENERIWSYDGVNFQYYTQTSTGETFKSTGSSGWDAAGNMYSSAWLDSAGVTVYDVLKFDGNLFTRLYLPNSANGLSGSVVLPNGEIYALRNTPQGQYYCSYYSAGAWAAIALPNNQPYLIATSAANQVFITPTNFNIANIPVYQLSGTNWLPPVYYQNTVNTYSGYATHFILTTNNEPVLLHKNNLFILTAGQVQIASYTSPIMGTGSTLNSEGIRGITAGPNGEIWAVYASFVMFPYKSTFQLLHYANGQWDKWLADADIDVISSVNGGFEIDPLNRKWTWNFRGLKLLVGKNWQDFALPPVPNFDSFYTPFFSPNGDIYAVIRKNIPSNYLVFKYNEVAWDSVYTGSTNIRDWVVDSSGRMLMVQYNSVHFHDGTQTQMVYPAFWTPSGNPLTACLSDSNTFLFLTENGDVYEYSGNPNDTPSVIISLPPTLYFLGNTYKMRKDVQGKVWIYGEDGPTPALYRLDGHSYIDYKYLIPNNDTLPTKGWSDWLGNEWIGTMNALYKYDGSTWTSYNYGNADIWGYGHKQLYVDSTNNIWYTSLGGISIFNESGIQANYNQTAVTKVGGKVFFDLNANGQEEPGEYPLAAQPIAATPANSYTLTDNNGHYYFNPTQGNYAIAVQPYPNWTLTTDSAAYHVGAGSYPTDSLDFGLNTTMWMDSLEVKVFAYKTVCKHIVNFWLMYKNLGTGIQNGTLNLTLDSACQYHNSIFYPPSQINGQQLQWDFQNLLPYETRLVVVQVEMPDHTQMGNVLEFPVSIQGINTAMALVYEDTLVCSWDPNDKQLMLPDSLLPNGEIWYEHPFDYLVRFQNTGNDVAFNIVIRDTLDADFDMTTFQVLGSSHQMTVTYNPDGQIAFDFPLIMLPDSGSNEPDSHGFVAYRVFPKNPATFPSSQVENTAAIYFDFNPPVITNTTQHTVRYFFTSLQPSDPDANIRYFPNPMNETATLLYDNPDRRHFVFTLYDLQARKVLEQADETGKLQFSSASLKTGIYFFELTDGKQHLQGKWLKK